MADEVRSTNEQSDDRREPAMDSSTPTAMEASRTALFGILLVIAALVVAGGVWWYVGKGSAAAEAEAARKIDSLGGFVHPGCLTAGKRLCYLRRHARPYERIEG